MNTEQARRLIGDLCGTVTQLQWRHCVAEICARVRLGQPQVSKHLSVLRNAGLVHVQPRGQQRFYALRAAPLRELDEWLERFRDIWGERFDQLDELLREMQKEKTR